MRHFLQVLTVAALSLTSASWAQASRDQRSYRLGPQDLVRIRVFEEPDLNMEKRVAGNGTIQLPLVGELPAEGLTEIELASLLKSALEKSYLQRASVTVEVIEMHSNPISVVGAVNRPGRLSVAAGLTLLEALNEAGGLTASSGDLVRVMRTADNGLSDQVIISIEELTSGQQPRLNIPIYPSDLISVPTATSLTIYLLGEVSRLGSQSFETGQRVTLLMALSRAGGLTQRASNKIMIRRFDGTSTEELSFNYKQLLKGQGPEVLLQDGDMIVVKESFF